MRSRCGISGVATLAIWLVGAGVSQAADFTWSGAASFAPPSAAAGWSNGPNWQGGTSPSGSVGTLTFPLLTNGACTSTPPTATCYHSNNDITGISATAISIDDGGLYLISGNGIALGAGGLTAATSAPLPGHDGVSLPITLAADQTWS